MVRSCASCARAFGTSASSARASAQRMGVFMGSPASTFESPAANGPVHVNRNTIPDWNAIQLPFPRLLADNDDMSGVLGRSLGLLEYLAARPEGMALASIADELGMPRSACHRLLG